MNSLPDNAVRTTTQRSDELVSDIDFENGAVYVERRILYRGAHDEPVETTASSTDGIFLDNITCIAQVSRAFHVMKLLLFFSNNK
jgi:hypothetical protein